MIVVQLSNKYRRISAIIYRKVGLLFSEGKEEKREDRGQINENQKQKMEYFRPAVYVLTGDLMNEGIN